MAASKKTLNAANLEQLGAKRLAELLTEISKGDAAAKRKLRLELAGNLSPKEAAKEVRKRLNSIARSRSFIDWHKVRDVGTDLEAQLNAISKTVAPKEPAEAFDLLKKFLSLAENIFERSDDGSGYLGSIFDQAREDMAAIAPNANLNPIDTADYVLTCIKDNGYGEYDGLISILAPIMKEGGLKHLKKSVLDWGKEAISMPDDERDFRYYDEDTYKRYRDDHVKYALQEIADAQGDVDGFIAQYTEDNQTVPVIAAEIADRLLNAGRIDEAWTAINKAESSNPYIWSEWEHTRIKVLEAKGDIDEVQKFRWSCFERSLSAEHLKAYLKQLPDFDDLEAEEKAFEYAYNYKHPLQALSFLLDWGKLDYAAKFVIERCEELDGDRWEFLPSAAQTLEEKSPLAAMVIYRTMIDYNLEHNKNTRYKHSGKHLMNCYSLATMIEDYQGLPSHEEYVQGLQKKYPRRDSFWRHVQ
ncbi:hypothetical protein GCM10011332_16060 [Terasakiella brassicae]|uniref:Uncharacterized protein n=1 Tax=Terasakiella brassicae TaxID=1634917 RepID=A0A917FCS8_9PROT|nr:DUF6880 family protein [Terasakiella brassicae]GGF62932.1 hypothetical protein GCM10011332_16060 [Terasakiella brassicae]